MTLATPYILTALGGATYESSVEPVYDSTFCFWRCQDGNGNAFNVADLTGAVFTVGLTSSPA